MEFVDNHYELPYPEPETVPLPLPVQEQSKKGQDDIICTMLLYDVSKSHCRFGDFTLKCMPKTSASKVIYDMSTFHHDARPKGFTDKHHDEHFRWDVKLNEYLNIEVKVLDEFSNNKYDIKTTKTDIKREEILFDDITRLPNASASVEFTIHLDSRQTTIVERQFRVTATTDLESKSRDYNIMFIPKLKL